MNAKRAFRPESPDTLEARDVPSSFTFHPMMSMPAATFRPVTVSQFNFSAPSVGGMFHFGGFGSTSNPFATARFNTAPVVTFGTFDPHSGNPWATYLSHPNRLSTDPAVLNGQADFVYNGQYMVGNRMSY